MNLLVEDWGETFNRKTYRQKEPGKELLEKVLLEAELLELKTNRTSWRTELWSKPFRQR